MRLSELGSILAATTERELDRLDQEFFTIVGFVLAGLAAWLIVGVMMWLAAKIPERIRLWLRLAGFAMIPGSVFVAVAIGLVKRMFA
jgi:hypothetical protein